MKAALLVFLLALALGAHAWVPSDCPQDCVFPEDWWAQHRPGAGFYWPSASEQKAFACGPTWLQVIVRTTTDSWTLLAQEYIAVQLNVMSFSCIQNLPDNITWAISEAENLLGGTTCAVWDQGQALYVLSLLVEFNSGNGDVHTCLCPANPTCAPSTQCPVCPTCTTPPLQCTTDVVQQCCQATTHPATTQPATTRPATTQPATTQPAPTTPAPTCGPCTRTQGYWKTHPELWTDFTDICGVSALSLLNAPSRGGDAFIILARQYIAARLNAEVLGVCLGDVTAFYLQAATLLGLACNSSSPTGYTAPTGGDRTAFVGVATVLDNFNNGNIGPGHCDGSDTSADVTVTYLTALEKSFAIDQSANTSAAGALVPVALAVLLALLLHAI